MSQSSDLNAILTFLDFDQTKPWSEEDFTFYVSLAPRLCHAIAVKRGWYTDLVTGEPKERNVGEMIALIHSEVSEALEGYRKGLSDDHLPHLPSIAVELADAIIRIFDTSEYLRLPLIEALFAKMAYNCKRPDHDLKVRAAEGGKKI